jgi:hypothetical protein
MNATPAKFESSKVRCSFYILVFDPALKSKDFGNARAIKVNMMAVRNA